MKEVILPIECQSYVHLPNTYVRTYVPSNNNILVLFFLKKSVELWIFVMILINSYSMVPVPYGTVLYRHNILCSIIGHTVPYSLVPVPGTVTLPLQ